MQYFLTNVEKIQCYICITNCNKKNGFTCYKCHKFSCSTCFEIQVQNQLHTENIGNFHKHHKNIICCHCKYYFQKQDVFKKLLQNKHHKTCHLYMEKIKENYVLTIPKLIPNYLSTDIQKHCTYINEEILNLHCPSCNIVFFDFDGCYAVKCNNCANYFCGWCLTGYESSVECHKHVIHCLHSMNKGYHFSNISNFNYVQNKTKKEKIRMYLTKLDDKTRKKVYEEMLKNFTDLQNPAIHQTNNYYQIIICIFLISSIINIFCVQFDDIVSSYFILYTMD